MIAEVSRAFSVGVPLVAIDSQDPGSVLTRLTDHFTHAERPVGVIAWDCVRGVWCASHDQAAKEAIGKLENPPSDYSGSPLSILEALSQLPMRCAVVILNAHRFLDDVRIVQAIWNSRDELKSEKKMLILLGCSVVPRELQHDVIVFDDPLPSEAELLGVVSDVCEWASSTASDDTKLAGAKAAVGVTTFAAENLAALAVCKEGDLDVEALWVSKRKKINSTPGLSVVSTQQGFDSIGGCASFKLFMTRVLNGAARPNAIVFVDEIEKALGSTHDTSGVSQDQLGQLLSWLQDKNATGMILVGPPGAAKSAIAKASGVEGGIPTIQLDLGGAKGSLVGESEAKIRDALKVIDAVSGGKTLWIATCNSLTDLPPELKRRFKFGTWFFDLPDAEERSLIWKIYSAKHAIEESYEDLIGEEWTGAEIQTCCELSTNLGISLKEAAKYIVPVSKAASEAILRLRSGAEGKFLSASTSGTYQRYVPAKKRKME
jgi:hypothetical protein